MSCNVQEVRPLGKAIYQLIVEAQDAEKKDRRSDVRFPFFRPVVIHLDSERSYAAFSRDISAFGIGLLHDTELMLGECDISISSEQGYSIRVRTRIAWCRPCGEGWHVSGGEFAGISAVGT